MSARNRECPYWETYWAIRDQFAADGRIDERESALLRDLEEHGNTLEAIADLARAGRISRDLLRAEPRFFADSLHGVGLYHTLRALGARIRECAPPVAAD